MLTTLRIIIIMIGAALVAWAFHLFFQNRLVGDIYWLDLGVSTFIYLSIMFNIINPINIRNFERRLAGMGIRWSIQLLYIVTAMTGMIVGYRLRVDMDIQFLYQVVFLFIHLIGTYWSLSANEWANNFKRSVDEVGANLEQMRDLVDRLNIILDTNIIAKNNDLDAIISEIKDNLRFITPSRKELAILLEQNFINEFNQIFLSIRDVTDGTEEIKPILDRCNKILIRRKDIYHK